MSPFRGYRVERRAVFIWFIPTADFVPRITDYEMNLHFPNRGTALTSRSQVWIHTMSST